MVHLYRCRRRLLPPPSASAMARHKLAPECSPLSRITWRRSPLASRMSLSPSAGREGFFPRRAPSIFGRWQWRRSLPRLNCAVVLAGEGKRIPTELVKEIIVIFVIISSGRSEAKRAANSHGHLIIGLQENTKYRCHYTEYIL